MKLKNAIPFVVIAAFGAGLTACGGGSVSTGGAGGGTGGTGATSSIVVQTPRTASADRFYGSPQQGNRLAAAISEFLIRAAMAQAGENVTLIDGDGNETTLQTNADGQAIFPVGPGDYTVCFGDPSVPTNCVLVEDVEEDQVVVATLGIDDKDTATTDDDEVVLLSAEADDAIDNIVAFQDPDAAHKTLVCHKDKFTISVGTPAAQNGHMAHGDSLGECASDDDTDTDDTDSVTTTSEDDDSGPGNSGNKGNNGSNGRGNPNA